MLALSSIIRFIPWSTSALLVLFVHLHSRINLISSITDWFMLDQLECEIIMEKPIHPHLELYFVHQITHEDWLPKSRPKATISIVKSSTNWIFSSSLCSVPSICTTFLLVNNDDTIHNQQFTCTTEFSKAISIKWLALFTNEWMDKINIFIPTKYK